MNKRYSIYPLHHPDLWERYLAAKSQHWDTDEVDLSADDWNSLSVNEQKVLKTILAFFSVSDGIVNDNLVNYVIPQIEQKEAEFFYNFQTMNEDIHALQYVLFIEHYIKDAKEKEKLYTPIESMKTVKDKADWALRWIESKKDSLAHKIVSFSIVEGLFFSSLFATVFYFRQTGKLPGLCQGNELIMKDEQCFIPEVEILTSAGWKKVTDFKVGDEVLQYNDDFSITSSKVLNTVNKPYKGEMLKIFKQDSSTVCTPDHRIITWYNKTGKKVEEAKDINFNHTKSIPVAGNFITSNRNRKLTNEERLRIAIQADGSYCTFTSKEGLKTRGVNRGYNISFTFRKKRKIERLKEILNNLNITFSVSSLKKREEVQLRFFYDYANNYKDFEWVNTVEKSKEWCVDFCEELKHWDGNIPKNNVNRKLIYSSINKKCIDKAQLIAILAGYKTNISKIEDNRSKNYNDCYKLSIINTNYLNNAQSYKKEKQYYEGNVYCISVESGTIITRYNNKVFITGNCHYEFAINYYKNHIHDKLPDEEVRSIILSAYEVEKQFVKELLEVGLPNLTKELMTQYVQYVVDTILLDYGLKKEFNVGQPLEFMNRIAMSTRSNFFERKSGTYTKIKQSENLFDEDF